MEAFQTGEAFSAAACRPYKGATDTFGSTNVLSISWDDLAARPRVPSGVLLDDGADASPSCAVHVSQKPCIV